MCNGPSPPLSVWLEELLYVWWHAQWSLYVSCCDMFWYVILCYITLYDMPNNIMCNGPSLLLVDIVLFGLTFKVFKMCLLGKGFHTLVKGISLSSPTNVGSYYPPIFRAQRSHWHSFLSSIDVRPPPNPLPFEAPTSLLAHRLVSTPLSGNNLFDGTLPSVCLWYLL